MLQLVSKSHSKTQWTIIFILVPSLGSMVHSSLSQLPVVKALSKQEITESQSKFYRMVVAAKEEGAASSVKDFIIKLFICFWDVHCKESHRPGLLCAHAERFPESDVPRMGIDFDEVGCSHS